MSLVLGLAYLPATSLADDIKPKAPETAFSGKLRPDILGISTESNAESARAIFDSLFKDRTDTKTDIQQQKFGGASYVAALNFSIPAGSKQNGEMLSTSFSSPASANRAYFVARNLTFAQDQQPSKADMVKEVMGKYGVPTIVGDQHLYYIYRKGSIMSVGSKYKQATALEAIDKPLDPRAAVKLNGDTVRGSCVAVVKRAQTKAKEPSAMLAEAKGANCDGVLSVQLVPGTPADRVGIAQFTLLDVKQLVSATTIDSAALAAGQNEGAMPKGSAPKL
ncbi:hypothetical protein [Bradyrhizobium sp. AZCC 1610]|uniref:hypothetical protein n=1 Tax=Bradyrhizobium sp. AZCC 1610 TaxID=3117020 RepID=UPI002FEEFD2B